MLLTCDFKASSIAKLYTLVHRHTENYAYKYVSSRRIGAVRSFGTYGWLHYLYLWVNLSVEHFLEWSTDTYECSRMKMAAIHCLN